MHELTDQLRKYAIGIWHRRWSALGVAWLVCIVGWTAVGLMPNRYTSEARLYVDTQTILGPLMQGIAVTPDIERQVEMMRSTLLSRPNLEQLIRMTDLDHNIESDLQRENLELGPHVGYLPQEVALFEGTMVENIARFGTPDAERVVAAAKAAGVHQLILQLPDGYGTEIGPGGARLSAGQRQRVALARALYGDPVLIVLDEPDSNLDEPGEQALAAAIRAQRERGATVVVVSHRPHVLRSVDYVLGLADGKVAWSGDAERVLAARRSGTPVVAAGAVYGSGAS